MAPASRGVESAGKLSGSRVADILWESAIEAFVRAILVLVMGSIAVELVGDLFKEMMPSLPPGLAGTPGSSAEAAAGSNSGCLWFKEEHQLFIIFVLLFVVTVWMRLAGHSSGAKTSKRLREIGRRLSDEWFGLIVGNAFGAGIGAMMLVWVEQFSFSRMVWSWLAGAVIGALQPIAIHVLGAARVDAIGGLFTWYGENQFKFAFWLLYFAAVCDDLGIPNLKTLARFLWRRFEAKRQENA